MLQKLSRAVSRRLKSLAGKMQDKNYRDGYVAAHTRQVLAKQMREFRGDMPQTEFADLIGKRQTQVSRLENSNYVGWTLTTMFEVAKKRDVAVLVRFVDFPTFLRFTEDMSEQALRPHAYDKADVDALISDPGPAPIILHPRKDDDPIPSFTVPDNNDKPTEVPTPRSGDPQVIEGQPTLQ
jgi:hypothetical protein